MISTALPDVPEVKSVIVFGSHARGDSDAHSDIDICILTAPIGFDRLQNVRQIFAGHFEITEDGIAVYPQPTLEGMVKAGSLFLWHLRQEGRILLDRNHFAANLLQSLPPFTAFAAELEIFCDLLKDLEVELRESGSLSEVDLYTAHMIVRDLCILLTYKKGFVAFGRKSAFIAARRQFADLPFASAVMDDLGFWHLSYKRGLLEPRPLPDGANCRRILDEVNNLLNYARKVLL